MESYKIDGTRLDQSENDKNKYHLFTLSNQVKVLLIEDLNNATADAKDDNVAYVSMSMNAGSFNDPPTRPGLAHFLEHMIFMGSSKYPDENAFGEFISNNGGYTNAYTENECTNYYFKVKYDSLKTALDMQAQLLAFPLLKEDAIMREIEAVNEEFEGNFSSDGVRSELLLNLFSL